MKNHFLFAYTGNKREEVETIHDSIQHNLDNITHIIEPFCGSSAFSFYISLLYPKRFIYVLNDFDNHLIELYRLVQNEELFNSFLNDLRAIGPTLNKELYNSNKNTSFIWWFIHIFYYQMVSGLFPMTHSTDKFIHKVDKLDKCPIINFLRNEKNILRNEDGVNIYKEYSTNPTSFIFLDPPYIVQENSQYSSSSMLIYKHLHEHDIKLEISTIVLVLEYNWVISILFPNEKDTYKKRYRGHKKKETDHLIINNKKNILI